MRKIYIILLAILSPFVALSQTSEQNPFGATQGASPGVLKLYMSKQSGLFTSISGSYAKTADEFEEGNCALTANGPILFTVNPTPAYGPSSTTNWTGLVKPDVAGGPAPGTSSSASLTGDYTVKFSKPGNLGGVVRTCNAYYIDAGGSVHDPHGCGGYHTIITKSGSGTINYEVISILITLPAQFECKDGKLTLSAEKVYPEGGYYLWDTPAGQISGATATINVDAVVDAGKTITVTYTVEGVTYAASSKIKFNKLISIDPPVCVKEETVLANVANDKYDGNCHPAAVFTPALLAQNWLYQTSEIPVSVAANGVVLNDMVVMVNEDKVLNLTPLNINFDFAGTAESALKALIGAGRPCNSNGSLKPKGGISKGSFKLCCPNDGGVIDGNKWTGALTWEYGMGCKFPIFGCPATLSMDVVLNAGISLTIGAEISSTCKGSSICIPVSASGTIGGGVGFTFATGIVSGNLSLMIKGIGVDGTYCFAPEPSNGQVSFTFGAGSIVGTIESFWGLTSQSVEYPLWSGYTTPPIAF